MKKSKSSISKVRSYKEIGDYWDKHDLSDVWAKTKKVRFEVVAEPEATYYPIQKDLSEKIQSVAKKQGGFLRHSRQSLAGTEDQGTKSGNEKRRKVKREERIKVFLCELCVLCGKPNMDHHFNATRRSALEQGLIGRPERSAAVERVERLEAYLPTNLLN